MNRRSFVHRSAFGTLSLGVASVQPVFNTLTFGTVQVSKWLQDMSWNLVISRKSKAAHAGASFEQITSAKNLQFTDLGYSKADEYFYFFGDKEQYAFYPLVSARASSDFVMPVFRQSSQGEWQYVQTLTSYQVEAMVKASNTLRRESPVKLQSLIFPVDKGSGNQASGSYATQDGSVHVITRLKKGRAMSTWTIIDHSGLVYKETFSSSLFLV